MRFTAPSPHGTRPAHPLNAVGPAGLGPAPGSGLAGRLGVLGVCL
ncbi:MAG TPA: hypothetical protein VH641_13380 [Streptosporangiaceae bacterium]